MHFFWAGVGAVLLIVMLYYIYISSQCEGITVSSKGTINVKSWIELSRFSTKTFVHLQPCATAKSSIQHDRSLTLELSPLKYSGNIWVCSTTAGTFRRAQISPGSCSVWSKLKGFACWKWVRRVEKTMIMKYKRSPRDRPSVYFFCLFSKMCHWKV